MTPRPPIRALALGVLGLGLFAPVRAQDEPKPPPEKPEATGAKEAGASRPLADLNARYDKQIVELEHRRLVDLAALAGKLSGDEADLAYRQLFHLAVARDEYATASKAAEDYLDSTKGAGHPELRALATFIGAVGRVNKGEYPEAIRALDRFLKGQTEGQTLDPNTVFTVGEGLLQRLIRRGRYDVAKQVCALFVQQDADPAVKAHFASRLARIDLLGKPAPPIEAPDVDGNPVRLADLRGKVVLIDFWATWAPSSASQIPEYRALLSKYGDRKFAILGVNLDAARQDVKDVARTRPVVRQFLLQLRVNWPNVFNGTGASDFARAYGVSDLPTNFLIDGQGKVIQVEQSGSSLEKAIAEAVGGTPRGDR